MARISAQVKSFQNAQVRSFDNAHLALIAFQFAVCGSIALFIVIALVNAILGAPELTQTQTPYGS